MYTFVRPEKEISKVQKLIAIQPIPVTKPNSQPPPAKKRKVELLTNHNVVCHIDTIWVKFNGHLVKELDKHTLVNGGLLNDKHIDFAQCLLCHQFVNVEGLQHNTTTSKLDQRSCRPFTIEEIIGF